MTRSIGRLRNSPWQAAQNAAYCGAQTVLAFIPFERVIRGDATRDHKSKHTIATLALLLKRRG